MANEPNPEQVTTKVDPITLPEALGLGHPRAAVKSPNLWLRRRVLGLLGLGSAGAMWAVLLNQFNRATLAMPDRQRCKQSYRIINNNKDLPKLTKIQFTSVKLDRTGKVIDRPPYSAEIFQENLGSGVSMTMARIPAGKFLMGSSDTEEDSVSSGFPQHQVKVPEFYMGQTLVTQAQWQAIMGNNPSRYQGDSNLPVDSVSWLDAIDFCQQLSQKVGKVYRLPSEAEWEYACRAGTTTLFAFGENINPMVVNYDGNYPYGDAAKGENRKKTTIVGSFPANAFGLHDMHGNLWEWCADEYVDDYQDAPVDGSARGDLNSRDSDIKRLLRGGSCLFTADFCRSASRFRIVAGDLGAYCGLRVVVVLKVD